MIIIIVIIITIIIIMIIIIIIASPSGHPPTLHLPYLFVLYIRRRRRKDIRR